MDIETPAGRARLTWYPAESAHSDESDESVQPRDATGLLLLGHGAGGGITAPDLLKVAAIARTAGMAVGLVEQPYRVAGRRPPAPAPQLDAAFVAVAAAARTALAKNNKPARKGKAGIPVIVGGRSSGARVASRTARLIGASGVLGLAFPLQPPRRKSGHEPASRLPELLAAGVPVLIVQGERDPFGADTTLVQALASSGATDVTVATASGADHSLRKGIDPTKISTWLARFLP